MIARSFEEVHSKAWLCQHIVDQTHEFVVLRKVIPFQKIMYALCGYYPSSQGRLGKDLRIMIALLILGKLRQIGDLAVIDLVKENRYAQYFCNVSDRDLPAFLDRSTICKFRSRIGRTGIARIEHHVFDAEIFQHDSWTLIVETRGRTRSYRYVYHVYHISL